MKVDPEKLRELAASIDDIGARAGALHVRAGADAVAGAMPSSPLAEICATAGEYVESAWLRMAVRCERMSDICRGSAGTYAVTDIEFRDHLAAMNARG
ncbi:type VII secretion target [Nocardia sp. NPDC049190]|uniref:type VII secretion target n=1 Tax=Nocardia sp. NPDC049190 TaxID=3155650 RepID=UPI0033EFED5B